MHTAQANSSLLELEKYISWAFSLITSPTLINGKEYTIKYQHVDSENAEFLLARAFDRLFEDTLADMRQKH